MVKIHGVAYLVLAGFITGYTLFIEDKGGIDLPVFYYVAAGIGIWGVFRLTSDYMSANKALDEERKRRAQQKEVGPPAKQRSDHDDHPHHAPVGGSHVSSHATHGHVRGQEHSNTHAHTRNPTAYTSYPSNKECPQCHRTVPSQTRRCICGFEFYR